MSPQQQIRNLKTAEANLLAALEATRQSLRAMEKESPAKVKDNSSALIAKHKAQWAKKYQVKSA